ncbi:hypothetical protein PVK06_017815 [Gossypium arboreum]|uniref:Uncharacterized protein n=1 Tax=Gossypium arboreum TaxID=29729 RepID=A0ABR0Q4X7_GOSAR|nr:hypothetical protein PVK06_017815 [Gossypium arboreum]
MAGEGIFTRLQKELDNRIGDRFKELKEEFCAELRFELQGQLHRVFEQYLVKILASGKGKRVMNGSPPRFSLRTPGCHHRGEIVDLNTQVT